METPNKWKTRSTVIVLAVICIDQITKAIVLKTMHLGQSIPLLGDWLRFTFTENPGMAFGIRFGPPAMITIFSIIATFLIILYLYKIGSIYGPYQASLSFVLGGAVGNIIDRVFFGKLLYDEPLFLGRVVDFIHINVWKGYLPDGIPLIGGNYMALFPIWNVADMSIVLGVVGIIFFQKKFHQKTMELEGVVPQTGVQPGPIVGAESFTPTTSASTELPGQTSSDA